MTEEPRTEGGTPPTGTPPTSPEVGSSSSATETPSTTPATLAKALEVAEELLQAVKRANPSSTGKQHAVPSPPLSTSAAKLHGYQHSQTKAKGLVKQTRTYLQDSIPKEGPPAWSMHMLWPPRRGCLLCVVKDSTSRCSSCNNNYITTTSLALMSYDRERDLIGFRTVCMSKKPAIQ